MRPIKFRAWDKNLEAMFPVKSLVHYANFTKMAVYLDDGNDFGHYCWSIPQYELMQFTGLLDRNGKEIWEGDIVALDYEGIGTHVREVGQVFWHGQGWDIRPQMRNNPAGCIGGAWRGSIEVIGNIHENGELVK